MTISRQQIATMRLSTARTMAIQALKFDDNLGFVTPESALIECAYRPDNFMIIFQASPYVVEHVENYLQALGEVGKLGL
jgi:hypothetical protein